MKLCQISFDSHDENAITVSANAGTVNSCVAGSFAEVFQSLYNVIEKKVGHKPTMLFCHQKYEKFLTELFQNTYPTLQIESNLVKEDYLILGYVKDLYTDDFNHLNFAKLLIPPEGIVSKQIVQHTKFETSFRVYPEDVNHMSPLIFGGRFFSHLDKAAATAVDRLLYQSTAANAAVTHKFEGVFHKPCYLGDLLFIEAEIVSLGKKSIVVQTKAFRELKGAKKPDQIVMNPVTFQPEVACEMEKETRELVAEAKFVFISITDSTVSKKPEFLPYVDHEVVL